MNYKVGILAQDDFFEGKLLYYDNTKQWAFTMAQLETYRIHKSNQSADLRDIVKWQRMEETFRKQYNINSNIMIEYES